MGLLGRYRRHLKRILLPSNQQMRPFIMSTYRSKYGFAELYENISTHQHNICEKFK